jgi:hypothetical protein
MHPVRTSERIPILALLALLACQPAPVRPALAVRSAPLDTLLALSRAATFVPVLGDSQRLMLGSYPTGRYGPRVQISPELRSYAHDTADLATGVLLARLVNFDTIPYPKMNLGPLDTVYLWTDEPGGLFQPARAFYVNARDGSRLERGIRTHPGPPMRGTMPAARFLWDDADEKTCVYCAWVEWCTIQ